MIIEFVDRNRAEFGVEPACVALQTAPSTYWSAKRRPPSARSKRDAVMMPILLALWQANYRVYGARKLWVAARRAGHDIGRDQVARLLGRLGIRGVKREKRVRTTCPDPTASRLEGLVAHADAGSQFTSIRYGERLDDLSPNQFEAAYAATNTDQTDQENLNIQPAQNPG